MYNISLTQHTIIIIICNLGHKSIKKSLIFRFFRILSGGILFNWDFPYNLPSYITEPRLQ